MCSNRFDREECFLAFPAEGGQLSYDVAAVRALIFNLLSGFCTRHFKILNV
jgi:hypothetical protein